MTMSCWKSPPKSLRMRKRVLETELRKKLAAKKRARSQ